MLWVDKDPQCMTTVLTNMYYAEFEALYVKIAKAFLPSNTALTGILLAVLISEIRSAQV